METKNKDVYVRNQVADSKYITIIISLRENVPSIRSIDSETEGREVGRFLITGDNSSRSKLEESRNDSDVDGDHVYGNKIGRVYC